MKITHSIETKERYLVQTQLQMKSSRIALPQVHSAKKTLNMNVLPAKQKIQSQSKKTVENKSRLGQGRAGIRHKKLQPVHGITASTSKSCEIPKIPMVQNVTKHSMDFPVQEQLITKRQKQLQEE